MALSTYVNSRPSHPLRHASTDHTFLNAIYQLMGEKHLSRPPTKGQIAAQTERIRSISIFIKVTGAPFPRFAQPKSQPTGQCASGMQVHASNGLRNSDPLTTRLTP